MTDAADGPRERGRIVQLNDIRVRRIPAERLDNWINEDLSRRRLSQSFFPKTLQFDLKLLQQNDETAHGLTPALKNWRNPEKRIVDRNSFRQHTMRAEDTNA